MKTMRYRTKVDINGNIYQLEVDNVNQKYAIGYSLFWSSSDDIISTKTQMRKIASQLDAQGYTRVDKV